jgi:hypothetical protein
MENGIGAKRKSAEPKLKAKKMIFEMVNLNGTKNL